MLSKIKNNLTFIYFHISAKNKSKWIFKYMTWPYVLEESIFELIRKVQYGRKRKNVPRDTEDYMFGIKF